MSARGLDHVVHLVRDLDAAGAAFEALGFTVGAENRHPWGTANRLVQFPGFFIELLTVRDENLIVPARKGQFSFGGLCRKRLKAGFQGAAMLVLESKGSAADKLAFDQAGIGGFDPFYFERQGRKPDGASVRVSFSLAFARNAAAPDLGFFTCLQHQPENFWNPSFQSHRNGVTGIHSAVFVAENPTDHHIFFSEFAGTRDIRSSSLGITVETSRGDIQIIDAVGYRQLFGAAWPKSRRRLALAGLRFTRAGNLPDPQSSGHLSVDPGRLTISPDRTFGLALSFEAAAGP